MKVLVLCGPESSGKSWLSGEIQAHFGGELVGEYVRHFINEQGRIPASPTSRPSPVGSWPGKTARGPASLIC